MDSAYVDQLALLSRQYGKDSRYVFLGGGNSSVKDDEMLYVKPSGVALATIEPADFIAMERAELRKVFEEDLPSEPEAREQRVKELMAAAVRPLGAGRASVEAPLHELLPQRFVMHLHPTMVNGMTCGKEGKEACERLFPDALWVEYVDPGCTLALYVGDVLRREQEAGRSVPAVIFLQNHGVFVGADTAEGIEKTYDEIMAALAAHYEAAGVTTAIEDGELDAGVACRLAPALRGELLAEQGTAVVNSLASFEVAPGPLTPDHVVYAKSFPLIDQAEEAVNLAGYRDRHGFSPKVISIPGKVVFSAGPDAKGAAGVAVAARDAALVNQLTEAFGGARYLDDREYQFIENWEVESYRRSVAAGARRGRMADRVCVVTGGAQGFGLGIAQELAVEGAVVVIADLNIDGATQAAEQLEAEHGLGRAFAVEVNIGDEESVGKMVEAVTLKCGGIDVFVANAGVLRAGSVKELTLRDWDFVTRVNYTGYFLCVKHVAPLMAAQNAAAGDGFWTDIIQVSSKSGLEGSNRNGAYAGSKFGGIGLTQSFAKELVEDRIKVNSICPGNYFDGPLWSDPEKGLFVQYLQTGKVEGAKTVEDVRRSYESKVPMNRGCRPLDVARAIFYTVEQLYETGQAIPVTGGQVMLR